ncbi:MAG: hypothetical protein WAS21_26680 [Geminicoccaceae bacterium]
MRLAIILISFFFIGNAVAAQSPEPLGKADFLFDQIRVYDDEFGQPGDRYRNLDVNSINRAKVMLLRWDDDTEMMLIDFGEGTVGWIQKSHLEVPAEACKGRSQLRTTTVVFGGNTDTRTIALIEKACR